MNGLMRPRGCPYLIYLAKPQPKAWFHLFWVILLLHQTKLMKGEIENKQKNAGWGF